MPGKTTRGIVYPTTDDPTLAPQQMQAMAQSVDNRFADLPFAMTAGGVYVNATANTIATTHVTFPGGLFQSTPSIVICPGTVDPTAVQFSTANLTSTGFDVKLQRTTTGTTVVQWIAVQNAGTYS